jgi:hypothetical protein
MIMVASLKRILLRDIKKCFEFLGLVRSVNPIPFVEAVLEADSDSLVAFRLYQRFASSVSLAVISKKLNPSAMKEYDIRGEYVYNA